MAPHVAVVGAGILGAAVAQALAVRGARVTVVERDVPGSGATGASFAWANATLGKEPRAYFDLHRLSLGDWRRLADELGPALPVRFGGTLEWQPPGAEAEALGTALRRHQSWGSSARAVAPDELGALVPGLQPGPVGMATFTPDEAAVDPLGAAQALLAAAGAELRLGCAVTAVESAGERVVVRTTDADVHADRAVLAAGIDTPALAAPLGVELPLVDSIGLLAHTAPLDPLTGPVLLAPGAHVLQRPDGRVVTGRDFAATSADDVEALTAEALRANAARFLPALAGATVERVTTGRRVLPADGLPLVGRAAAAPNVYVVATHSGISLAPVLARLIATEVLDEVEVDLLAPFRLDRADWRGDRTSG